MIREEKLVLGGEGREAVWKKLSSPKVQAWSKFIYVFQQTESAKTKIRANMLIPEACRKYSFLLQMTILYPQQEPNQWEP